MFRRLIERAVAAGDPLAALQRKAVLLQDEYGTWPALFFEELEPGTVAAAMADPHLADAESLFRRILEQGRGHLPSGALAATCFQLGLLLHRQGRLAEAEQMYEEAVRFCRVSMERTDTEGWALTRALFRLAEIAIRHDRLRGEQLFAEARELALERRERYWIEASRRAAEFFGLPGGPIPQWTGVSRKETQGLSAYVDDLTALRERPRALTWLGRFVAVGSGAGALVVARRFTPSWWLAGFAGWCVGTLLGMASAAPRRQRKRMLALYGKGILAAAAVVALVQYIFRLPWLATIFGMLAFTVALKRLYERPSRA